MNTTWAMPSGSGGRWPEVYERGRPGWPVEAIHVTGMSPTATVLDLGAGTGKLTRLLVTEFERVVAVEPSTPMRRLIARHCPAVEVLAGTGQEIPVPDASVDAVYAAQAFHWFDEASAMVEIARVLRPGGALILMWNRPGGPWEPSTERAEEVLTERMPAAVDHIPLDLGGPEAASGWHPAAAESPFGVFASAKFANPQSADREGVVAFYASMGWLADLPDEERLPLLDEVRSYLIAPEYRRRWETHVHWTHVAGGVT
jgi:SAM-dependent methyltransferase